MRISDMNLVLRRVQVTNSSWMLSEKKNIFALTKSDLWPASPLKLEDIMSAEKNYKIIKIAILR